MKFIILGMLFFLKTSFAFSSDEIYFASDKVKKIALVVHGPKEGISESSLGHVALRISNEDNFSLKDMMLEFSADIPADEIMVKKYLKGIGIVSPYPAIVKPGIYYDIKEYKTKNEYREIANYELILSTKQKEHLLDELNLIVHSPEEQREKYRFFNNNCSSLLAKILEDVYGIKFKLMDKNVPILLPKGLEKHHLIANKFVEDDALTQREKIIDKMSPKINFDELTRWPKGYQKLIFKKLLSKKFDIRILGYVKLKKVLRESKDRKNSRLVKDFLNILMSTETQDDKRIVKQTITDEIDIKSFFDAEKLFLQNESVIMSDILQKTTQLAHRNERGFIKLSYSIKRSGNGEQSSYQKMIEVPKMSYRDGKYYYNGNLIAVELPRSKTLDVNHVIFSEVEIIDHTIVFNVHLVFSTNSVIVPDDFNKSNAVALNNVKDFKSPGACYALALLQKKLLDGAFFLPTQKRLSDDDYIKLFEDLVYHQKFVVFPGFKSIAELTSSIEKNKLVAFVSSYQEKLHSSKSKMILDNLFERNEIKSHKDLKQLELLLSLGVNVPLIVVPRSKDGSKNFSGHVIVVDHMIEASKDKFKIAAFDPNADGGVTKLLTIDRKTFQLDYPFFNTDKYFYTSVIDKMDFSFEGYLANLRQSKLDMKQIALLIHTEQKYSFTPVELAHFFEY